MPLWKWLSLIILCYLSYMMLHYEMIFSYYKLSKLLHSGYIDYWVKHRVYQNKQYQTAVPTVIEHKCSVVKFYICGWCLSPSKGTPHSIQDIVEENRNVAHYVGYGHYDHCYSGSPMSHLRLLHAYTSSDVIGHLSGAADCLICLIHPGYWQETANADGNYWYCQEDDAEKRLYRVNGFVFWNKG